MKTRIIQTRFWEDSFVYNLNPNAKLLFLYFLTNKRIELTGVYELPLPIMSVETLLTNTEIQEALKELYPKVAYIDGFVVIKNATKYQNYNNGNTHQKSAFEKEYINLPESVKLFLENEITTSPTTSHITSYPTRQNIEIRNKKTEIRNKKEKKTTSCPTSPQLVEVVNFYNQVFSKSITSTKAFEENFEDWFKIHDIEKIKRAIVNARQDKYWQDKMTLTILFRKKNQRNENVDYIEDLANRTTTFDGSVGKTTKIAFS